MSDAEKKASIGEIKDYVLKQSGLKVNSRHITQVKKKCGMIEQENYNKPKSENARQTKCLTEKEAAITEALQFFGII